MPEPQTPRQATTNDPPPPAKPSLLKALGFVPWIVIGMLAVVVVANLGRAPARNHASDQASGTDLEVPPDPVAWSEDPKASFAAAASSDKPVLLDFTADWCPPCQSLKTQFYSIPEVKKTVETRFVPLKVDLTRQGDAPNAWVAQKYGVHLLPTLVVVSSNGKELTRFSAELTVENLRGWLDKTAQEHAPKAR